MIRIAIDTGGTFTDCVSARDGDLKVLKLASTPDNPADSVLAAVQQIAGEAPADIRHGTTVATNALLERKGARVAFVTTAGFEDTLAIGRQARPKLYDLFIQTPPPLVPRELRFGVTERVGPDGEILQPISSEELQRLKASISGTHPEAIAISLLFSFANSKHEQAIASALAGLGVPVSVSHEILPEFREYERASTVVTNAYLAPKMQSYLRQLDSQTSKCGGKVNIMQSSGGIVPAGIAAREPVRTILSGPAGGVIGASAIAKHAGFDTILTFDMGGTSTDVAFVNTLAPLHTSTETTITGIPVAVPMLSIHTVGAGGGSIARFDAGNALRVGPESAGADPGPICYGRGVQPTVTDANLLLGRLDPDHFLGGSMKLDRERTIAFFEREKGSLSSRDAFAAGIVLLADSHMERALRRISIEQGRDPRESVLIAFGGAGPLHACALASALRIPRVLIPQMPGALSAYGILVSDVVRDYSRTIMTRPADPDIADHFSELERSGLHEFAAQQLHPAATRFLDMRYAGQGYEITVPSSLDSVSDFHRTHAARFGYSDELRPVEVVNVRVRLTAASEPILPKREPIVSGDGRQALLTTRLIFSGDRWTTGRVYDRDRLRAGDKFRGPAVVTEYSATTFVPEDTELSVDALRNLLISVP
jgi:N-methylhydantoinase A